MKKILAIILAYEAEGQIESLLARIPSSLFSAPDYRCDLLILDDASPDDTVSKARNYLSMHSLPAMWLINVNRWLIKLNKRLFSYQIAVVARPLPTLDTLIADAELQANARN